MCHIKYIWTLITAFVLEYVKYMSPSIIYGGILRENMAPSKFRDCSIYLYLTHLSRFTGWYDENVVDLLRFPYLIQPSGSYDRLD